MAALRIEISENEQREEFTFSEKMDFAAILAEIEREKAKLRKSLGGKGGLDKEDMDGPVHILSSKRAGFTERPLMRELLQNPS